MRACSCDRTFRPAWAALAESIFLEGAESAADRPALQQRLLCLSSPPFRLSHPFRLSRLWAASRACPPSRLWAPWRAFPACRVLIQCPWPWTRVLLSGTQSVPAIYFFGGETVPSAEPHFLQYRSLLPSLAKRAPVRTPLPQRLHSKRTLLILTGISFERRPPCGFF